MGDGTASCRSAGYPAIQQCAALLDAVLECSFLDASCCSQACDGLQGKGQSCSHSSCSALGQTDEVSHALHAAGSHTDSFCVGPHCCHSNSILYGVEHDSTSLAPQEDDLSARHTPISLWAAPHLCDTSCPRGSSSFAAAAGTTVRQPNSKHDHALANLCALHTSAAPNLGLGYAWVHAWSIAPARLRRLPYTIQPAVGCSMQQCS